MPGIARSQLVAAALTVCWLKLAILHSARGHIAPVQAVESLREISLWSLYLLEVLHQDLTVAGLLLALAWWLRRQDGERGRAPATLLILLALSVSLYHALAYLYWRHHASFPPRDILTLWNLLPVALQEAFAEESRTHASPVLLVALALHLVALPLRDRIHRLAARMLRATGAQVFLCVAAGLLIATWATRLPSMLFQTNLNPLVALVLVPGLEEQLRDFPAAFEGDPPPAAACDDVMSLTSPGLPPLPANGEIRRLVIYLWESVPHAAAFDARCATRIPDLAPLSDQMVVFSRLHGVQPASFPSLVSLLLERYAPGRLKYGPLAPWIAAHAPASRLSALRALGWKLRAATSTIEDHGGYADLFAALGFEPMVHPGQTPAATYRRHTWGADDRFLFDTARRWTTEDPEEKQLLVLVGSATHHPYHYEDDPPDGRSPKERHLALVRETGALAAGFHRWLQDQGRAGETLFLVVGDHGQAFGEHEGNWIHGARLYDENTRVAGFLLHPGRLGLPAEIPEILSTSEIMRVLLDPVLGPPARESERDHAGFALSFHPLLHGRVALVADHRKLVVDLATRQRELYDLVADPQERRDLAVELPQVAGCYQRFLAERIRSVAASWR